MADTEIEIIECRDCESKNCYGCNVLTLSQMLNKGKFDSLMDEHHSINPAADVVEVKHGRWYWAEDGHCKCSVCGQYAVVKRIAIQTNYCPNCGARMDGEWYG